MRDIRERSRLASVRRGRRMIIGLAALTAAVTGALTAAGAAAATAPAPASWPVAGQDLSNTRFQGAEHQLTPARATRLTPRWTLTTHGNVAATPTVAGGAVYVPDQGGTLWAVSSATGRVL